MSISFRLLRLIVSAVLAAISGSIIYIFVNTTGPIPVTSPDSISFSPLTVLFLGLSVGVVTIGMYHREYNRDLKVNGWVRRLTHSFLQFPFRFAAAIGIIFLVGSFYNIAIHGLASIGIDPVLNALLAGLFSAGVIGITCYLVAEYVHDMSNTRLIGLVAAIFIVAITEGIVNAETDRWWQEALSALGTDRGSFIAFDIAFIMGGLLALSVIRDGLDSIREIVVADVSRYLLLILEILFIIGCAGLIGVGLFPWTGATEQLHNQSAKTGFITLTIAIVILTLTAPRFDRAFRITSALMISVAIAAVVIESYGLINWTTMELVQIVAIGAWVAYFTQQTHKLIEEAQVTLAPEM